MNIHNLVSFESILLIFTVLINLVFSAPIIFELRVIPVDGDVIKAGENNHLRISVWNKSWNRPVSMDEMELLNDSMFDVIIVSKDLRSFSQLHFEDFPQYNNETAIPPNSNYFDIDYIFPLAGDYTISVKCRTTQPRKNIRVNKLVTAEGKTKMNIETLPEPSNPEIQKVIYYHPVQLDNVQSIYSYPLIPHTQIIAKKDLEKELSLTTNPIYGTKYTLKNKLKAGFCNNIVLEFFVVEVDEQGDIKENPINTLFQYNNIPIRVLFTNKDMSDIDMAQGSILDKISDKFPNCGGKIEPPNGMVYGPNFGFSIPYRKTGLYQLMFEISHSYNGNTYLLTPSISLLVPTKDQPAEYADEDYLDKDDSYKDFIENVINKEVTAPDNKTDNDNSNDTNDNNNNNEDKTNKGNTTIPDTDTTDNTDQNDNTDNNDNADNTDNTDTDTTDNADIPTDTDNNNDSTEIPTDTNNDSVETPTNTNNDNNDKADKNDDKDNADKTDDASEEIPTETQDKEETVLPTTNEAASEEKVSNGTHGKIILVGIAGIISVSGFM